jgi:hypothetical protein
LGKLSRRIKRPVLVASARDNPKISLILSPLHGQLMNSPTSSTNLLSFEYSTLVSLIRSIFKPTRAIGSSIHLPLVNLYTYTGTIAETPPLLPSTIHLSLHNLHRNVSHLPYNRSVERFRLFRQIGTGRTSPCSLPIFIIHFKYRLCNGQT